MIDVVGKTIKGYELQQELGQGGFGAVYRAFQPAVKREVAIKIILPEYANQPDFIRRFETEAQLVARLEHIHIVPLYDFWRDPEGAYLVMRMLKGGSLRSSLRNGPWEIGLVAVLLDQITSALTVAHRNGVVHRDLKPDNLLLDEDGNAYLADFGIAKDLAVNDESEDDMMSGSLPYLSPEQIRGDPITPSTDIYSLGIVLYEMLTGINPLLNESPATVVSKHLFEPLPPMGTLRSDLPEILDHVVQRATAKMPEERFETPIKMAAAFRDALQELADAGLDSYTVGELESARLAQQASAPTVQGLTVTPVENPYKGLRAFQQADYLDFYGREALVGQLLDHFRQPGAAGRFLAVVGPSGSGKSSVVKAGLIPALRSGEIAGSELWFLAEMTPGANPFQALETALLSIAVNAPSSTQLQESKGGLSQMLSHVLPDDESELVLVFDQFEELFTQSEDEKIRSLFLDSLLQAATAPDSRLRIIITLRADFYDRPLLYPEFGDLLRRSTEVVLPLNVQELQLAITGPADRVGLLLESGLVEAIQQAIGEQPGALPLLQYALTELYERRDGNMLTLQAYQNSGGVLGALARRADELYEGLDEAAQKAARQVFLRLVTLGEGSEDTRRRVHRSELAGMGDDAALDRVIDAFSRYRLLTLDRDATTRSPTIEIAHEALIRTWVRLRGWLNDSRDDLRIQRLLAAAAAEWLKNNREASFLASGARLDQFTEWSAKTDLVLNEDERTYIAASVAEREARRIQDEARKAREAKIARRAQNFGRVAAIAAVVSILAVFLTVFAGFQANAAGEQRSTAVFAQQQALAQVAIAGQTLTPIPVTLNAVVTKVQAGNNIVESLRLSAAINVILQDSTSEQLPAVLLGIRALNTAYTSQADVALQQALESVYARQDYTHVDFSYYAGAFSPTGSTFLTGSEDATARLWDTRSGQLLRVFLGHKGGVYAVAYSPDGKSVLTGGADATVRLWDIATGKEIREFKGHGGAVKSVAFAPDGKTLLTGSDDTTVWLWDTASGAKIREFDGHGATVWSAVFSPDGKTILTGSADSTAILWDVATGQPLRQFLGHTDLIRSVAYSPDGKLVATGSGDKTVRLWEVATGKEIRQIAAHKDGVLSVAFSPDGTTVLSGGGVLTGANTDKTVRLWDVATGQLVREFKPNAFAIWSAVFTPDGNSILTAGKEVRLWDVKTGQLRRPFYGSFAFSPDGKQYASGGTDKIARLFDTQSGHVIREFQGHTDTVNTVNFAPDGKTLITGSMDHTIRTWDISTGKQLHTYAGHTGPVYSIIYSRDGKTFISGSGDTTVRLWDVQTGRELRIFTGHIGEIYTINFSPDDRYILSGGKDGTVRLWDAATGKELRQFVGHTTEITSVTFSPDGSKVLTSSEDDTVRLWDAQTAKEIRHYTGEAYTVWSLTFSPDGTKIATASDDRTARIWDVQSGQELRQFVGRSASVQVSFSPDGRLLLTGSQDMTAQVWEVDYHDYLFAACSRVSRDFTWAERLRYGIPDTKPTCSQFDPTATVFPYSSATWTPVATRTIPAYTPLPALTGPTTGPNLDTPQPTLTPSATLAPTSTPTLIPVTLDWTPHPLPTLPDWTPIAP